MKKFQITISNGQEPPQLFEFITLVEEEAVQAEMKRSIAEKIQRLGVCYRDKGGFYLNDERIFTYLPACYAEEFGAVLFAKCSPAASDNPRQNYVVSARQMQINEKAEAMLRSRSLQQKLLSFWGNGTPAYEATAEALARRERMPQNESDGKFRRS